jgi:hypothetical protein
VTIAPVPRDLTYEFWHQAVARRRPVSFIGDEPACWLASFDPYRRPCTNDRRWQAFHFLGRQEIRTHPPLGMLTPEELVELEWDPRNGGPGCLVHHVAYDGQDGRPERLVVPRASLPADTEEFIAERGLDLLAERKFSA